MSACLDFLQQAPVFILLCAARLTSCRHHSWAVTEQVIRQILELSWSVHSIFIWSAGLLIPTPVRFYNTRVELFFNICIGKALPQTEYTQARVKVQLTQNELKLFEQSLTTPSSLKKSPLESSRVIKLWRRYKQEVQRWSWSFCEEPEVELFERLLRVPF